MELHNNPVMLLGPQRNAITVTDELDRLGLAGKIATITAGWQEREAEDRELQDAIGHRAVNLALHARVDRAFHADQDLFLAHRARQDELRRLQGLYRLRLDAYLGAAQALFHRAELDEDGEAEMVVAERKAAVQTLRDLDAHHLDRIARIHARFEDRIDPARHPALRREIDEVAAILDDCAIVAVAGGHVATLLGRIRLLRIAGLFGSKPVIGWSAGAMVLCERVVLFHDRPPEGPGNAEVLDVGLGLARGVVALPHATRRLALDDAPRMALFAQRFSPALCVALDPYARARNPDGGDPTGWQLHDGTWCVDDGGRLTSPEVEASYGDGGWAGRTTP